MYGGSILSTSGAPLGGLPRGSYIPTSHLRVSRVHRFIYHNNEQYSLQPFYGVRFFVVQNDRLRQGLDLAPNRTSSIYSSGRCSPFSVLLLSTRLRLSHSYEASAFPCSVFTSLICSSRRNCFVTRAYILHNMEDLYMHGRPGSPNWSGVSAFRTG